MRTRCFSPEVDSLPCAAVLEREFDQLIRRTAFTNLRDLVSRFGELAKAGNTLVLPANLTDVGSMIALAMNIIRREPESRS